MKKYSLALTMSLVGLLATNPVSAQLQQGNAYFGASSSLAGISFGLGSTNDFHLQITPKIGYFIENNLMVGGLVDLDYTKVKGIDGIFNYKINAFGRYYIPKGQIYNPVNDARFFFEVQAGIGGKPDVFGFNLAAGVGVAYFITNSIALETSAMVHSMFGAGSNTGLGINVGFAFHLPTGQLREELRKVESEIRTNNRD